MRKFLVLLLVTCMLCISLSAITPEEDGYVYVYCGDMNGDGEYGIVDAILLLKVLVNHEKNNIADVDRDGKVTLLDVLKVMKAVVSEEESMRVIDEKYLPISHLENFSEKSVSLSVGGAEARYSAAYTDSGITVTMDVSTDSYSKEDYVAINLQGMRSIAPADRRCVRFIAFADGSYRLRRHLYSEGELTIETAENATTPNDIFYYTYTKTNDGYTVTVFTSYDFLNVTSELSFGKTRLLPMMRSGDTVTYNAYGAAYSEVDTWLVCDGNGNLIRDDFDMLSFAEDIPKSSSYASLDFLHELATISAGENTMKTAAVGAQLFSNRIWGLEENGLPTELIGTAFAYGPIAGTEVTVTKAGYVVLVASELSIYDVTNKKILAAGFDPLVLVAPSLVNSSVGRTNADLANWYVKYCEAGETIKFGKWTVPFAKGETTAYAYETVPASVHPMGDDYYSLEERNWQGCPTVAVTKGGRIFASWISGGTSEPHIENYDILVYSDDGGESWIEYGVIDTCKSTDESKAAKVNDSQLWLDPETNILYALYIQSDIVTGFGKNSAVWMFTIDNPDASVEEWNISEHRYAFPGKPRNDIVVLSDGTWLATPEYYYDGRYTAVYASDDKGVTWTLRGKAYIPQATTWDEPVLVELNDGTIWMTVRTAHGTIYQSFSFDKGVTWTMGTSSGITAPSSRFQIFRTHSGALCIIWNNDPTSRINLSAALSYDEGKTWTDPLLIYAPKNSYPDYSIDTDGTIHIVVDSGRYKGTNSWQDENGKTCWGAIFYVALTEERIAKGGALAVEELTTISCVTE